MATKLASGCYFGEKIGENSIADLRLSEYRYCPHQVIERHAHEQVYLCLVLQGAFTETSARNDTECFSSSIVLHPQGEYHANQFHSQGATVFNVELEGKWLERLEPRAPLLNQRWEEKGGSLARFMYRLYEEYRQNDLVSPLAIEGLMLELFATLHRHGEPLRETRPPRWLEKAKLALEERCTEPLTLRQIATETNVHPTHLARVFRQYFRCSVGEYVRECRVRYACDLLEQENISLVEIAKTAGFADQSHFSRAFKRHYGKSPARYRESCLRR